MWIRKIYIFDLQMGKDFNTCLLTCTSLQETALQEGILFFQSAVNIFLDQANCGSSEGNRDNPIMVSIFDRGLPLTG